MRVNYNLKDRRYRYLYFPLGNEAGMMSAITPELKGDIKTGQNRFLLPPTSAEDLHESTFGRHFWLWINNQRAWNVAGTSAQQRANCFTEYADEVSVELGFLWHKVTRQNRQLGIKAEILNFVPTTEHTVELMQVTLTNISDQPLEIVPTAAIPIYGRSADNLRDHRHVTALLHQINCVEHGVIVKPTLSFDERGHRPNKIQYGIFGHAAESQNPVGFFPIMEDFTGESGNLDWPETVVRNQQPTARAGDSTAGYEAIGALRFKEVTIAPGESKSYRLALAIDASAENWPGYVNGYLSSAGFQTAFEHTEDFWRSKLDALVVKTGDEEFNNWFRWVTLQPILRRIYGCSFLPHHDYGRGGRGWRDLWQDCLALLFMEPEPVRDLLYSNFAGIRFDGSNATIIGSRPGEFIADRNSIPRVWMDHGVWPFLTTKLYLDQSGDLDFLLQEQTYFKDKHIHRCSAHDENWHETDGTVLQTIQGQPYRGTIIEHLLIQHLTSFLNVGGHNHIRLEGADWNDGLDMAEERGESVAFTAMYGRNLLDLADLLQNLNDRCQLETITLAAEISPLLDPVDYDSVSAKRERLSDFFKKCETALSGAKITVKLIDLSIRLREKGQWILDHIRGTEWIDAGDGLGWFNAYYNNDGQPLENEKRMTLTGQVFSLMSGVASDEQVLAIIQAVNRHLWDDAVGGPRLNTDFGEVLLNMGRSFGFAFGHKENGAMFSHMAVMYAFALYSRGRDADGWRVLQTIFEHGADFEKSRIYPGVPEYVDPRGRGMYHYLTGSASWYLYTILTRTLGVRGHLGELVLDPRLPLALFDENGQATVETIFGGKRIRVIFRLTADGVVSQLD